MQIPFKTQGDLCPKRNRGGFRQPGENMSQKCWSWKQYICSKTIKGGKQKEIKSLSWKQWVDPIRETNVSAGRKKWNSRQSLLKKCANLPWRRVKKKKRHQRQKKEWISRFYWVQRQENISVDFLLGAKQLINYWKKKPLKNTYSFSAGVGDGQIRNKIQNKDWTFFRAENNRSEISHSQVCVIRTNLDN